MGLVDKGSFALGIAQSIAAIIELFVVGQQSGIEQCDVISGPVQQVLRIRGYIGIASVGQVHDIHVIIILFVYYNFSMPRANPNSRFTMSFKNEQNMPPPTEAPKVTVRGTPRLGQLNAPMINRVHHTKPGCSSCGKKVA